MGSRRSGQLVERSHPLLGADHERHLLGSEADLLALAEAPPVRSRIGPTTTPTRGTIVPMQHLLALRLGIGLLLFAAVLGCEGQRPTDARPTLATSRVEPSAAANVSTSPRPRGLFAVVEWGAAPRPETWQSELLAGVVVRTYWKDLNPRRGVYEWGLLDSVLRDAEAAHKQIHLIVAPGFYAPTFVLEDPGVQKAAFDIPKGPKHKAALSAPLPLPWDEKYLAEWFSFVDRLAERYATRPGLGYVSITGPNSHNGEISLPRGPDDVRKWLELSRGDADALSAKLSTAWRRTIDHYCVRFRAKHATLAIILRSLPLAGDPERDDRYKRGLVAYGTESCAATFGVQTNGLDARDVASGDDDEFPTWQIVGSYSTKILTGLQTRAPGNLFGAKQGRGAKGGPDASETLRRTLRNGLAQRPDFIEVYEQDALAADFAPVLHKARDELTRTAPSPGK